MSLADCQFWDDNEHAFTPGWLRYIGGDGEPRFIHDELLACSDDKVTPVKRCACGLIIGSDFDDYMRDEWGIPCR